MSNDMAVREKRRPPSAWAPFGHVSFAVLWLATVVSNVGTWMHDVGAGWLMTELSPSPLLVAAVQAATTLPVFMFALMAGAVADIVDRRKLLIVINLMMTVAAACLAVLVACGLVTPLVLLVFTFILGTGAAFMAPAWQAIVPALVPRQQLSAAIALNSMGINVSRAIGPALAGFLIVAVGLWSPFALNALSFIGIIAALLWWRPPAKAAASQLPAERIGEAIVAGLRYSFNSGPLRATLVRAFVFFIFASAFWAMLPLVARNVLSGGPTLYGLMLTSVGTGAVIGAVLLPRIKSALGPDRTVAAGTAGTAAVLSLMAVVPIEGVALAAAAVAGLSWIAVLSSLHVSAQTSLPDWVRARGLSIFLTVFFGAMSAGSLVWGQIASVSSIETSLLIADLGAVAFVPLTWHARLGQGDAMDLSPSLHWPAPLLTATDAMDRGPVMIQVTYNVRPESTAEFLALMPRLAAARRRHGAYSWTLMQAADDHNRFVETWFEASWLDHLRHHERFTKTDMSTQEAIAALQRGDAAPRVQHFVRAGARRDR